MSPPPERTPPTPPLAAPPGAPDLPPAALPPPGWLLYLQSDFPWLATPRRLAVSVLVLVVLGFGLAEVVGRLSQPPVPVLRTEQRQLRSLLSQVEECRGTESLLVMLRPGAERDAAAEKLLQQQRRIASLLQDPGAGLATSLGVEALAELREAAAAWRTVQQRLVQAADGNSPAGTVNASRELMTGPSADAYRRLVTAVERAARRLDA